MPPYNKDYESIRDAVRMLSTDVLTAIFRETPGGWENPDNVEYHDMVAGVSNYLWYKAFPTRSRYNDN